MIMLVNTKNGRTQMFCDKLSAMNFAIRRYRFYKETWKLNSV